MYARRGITKLSTPQLEKDIMFVAVNQVGRQNFLAWAKTRLAIAPQDAEALIAEACQSDNCEYAVSIAPPATLSGNEECYHFSDAELYTAPDDPELFGRSTLVTLVSRDGRVDIDVSVT
jgi:hypothetical protein